METKEKQQPAEAPRYRNVYGSGKYKWAIYPDYWKASWGPKPMLGIIYADDEFYAEREAYSKGLLTVNYTIRPQPVKIGEAKPRPPRPHNNQTFNKE
jgi:hypothetical protein